MRKILLFIRVFLIFFFVQNGQSSPKGLLIFAGAASKPAAEEVAKVFQNKTGILVDIIFGGSGFVLSQMKRENGLRQSI